jgi:hypothetical protein
MEQIGEQIKKLGESKILLKVLYALGILIIAKLIFIMGILVGSRNAAYGQAWEEHYDENFGMGNCDNPVCGMRRLAAVNYFPIAHGATGKIIKIENQSLILQDKENIEKAISIDDGTIIQKGRANIGAGDLRVDDFGIVIGSPDANGVIEAKFIRILPRPELLQ